MKEIHIISTGNSLISNAQRNGIIDASKKVSDEDYWCELMNDKQMMNRLQNFLREAPLKNSAELNTFLRVVENKNPEDLEIYLFGTKTSSNELCRRAIENYLKEMGYKIYTPYEISGYFMEALTNDKSAMEKFKTGISELIERLIHIARIKKEEGYRVYFNPTGGLKAHVIATAFVAFITDCEIYYMNEEFNQVFFFPKLFFFPKGRQRDLLAKISEGLETKDFDNVLSEFSEEIETFKSYGLIEIDKNGQKIKITNKGYIIVEGLLQ